MCSGTCLTPYTSASASLCSAAPAEYETAPTPRARFNVYNHSLQGQEAYHAAPGALQKEAASIEGVAVADALLRSPRQALAPVQTQPRSGTPPASPRRAATPVQQAVLGSPRATAAPVSPKAAGALNSPRAGITPVSPRAAPVSPRAASPAPVSPRAAPLSPGAQQAAAAFDKQGPLHDGLITLPIPSECQVLRSRDTRNGMLSSTLHGSQFVFLAAAPLKQLRRLMQLLSTPCHSSILGV
jgi:hypothetical protein